MAFGYPAFTPAEGDLEFRVRAWQVSGSGLEQIGDAAVIRRALADAPPRSEAGDSSDDAPAGPASDKHRLEQANVLTQPVDMGEAALWGDMVARSDLRTEPVNLAALFAAEPAWNPDHPSGPLPQAGPLPVAAEVPESPGGWLSPLEADPAPFDATLTGPLGLPELGFRGGRWYTLGEQGRAITVREAMRLHPDLSARITQLVCWWMRRQPMSDRAVDLAFELATAVADFVPQQSV